MIGAQGAVMRVDALVGARLQAVPITDFMLDRHTLRTVFDARVGAGPGALILQRGDRLNVVQLGGQVGNVDERVVCAHHFAGGNGEPYDVDYVTITRLNISRDFADRSTVSIFGRATNTNGVERLDIVRPFQISKTVTLMRTLQHSSWLCQGVHAFLADEAGGLVPMRVRWVLLDADLVVYPDPEHYEFRPGLWTAFADAVEEKAPAERAALWRAALDEQSLEHFDALVGRALWWLRQEAEKEPPFVPAATSTASTPEDP